MELNLDNFPIVEVIHNQRGNLAEFTEQLDQLLQKRQSFVLIRNLMSKFNEPSPTQEQWKQAIQWIKAHKEDLSIIKGWVEISEEKVDQKFLERDQKIWKIPFYQIHSREEALIMGQKLLSF